MDNETFDRYADLYSRLRWPEGPIDVVMDTDTYNEIDDQFALAYLLLSGEKLTCKGICAAPFQNDRSDGPADGAEKSFHEIHKVLRLMKREDMIPLAFRGSDRFLPSEKEPVESEAARALIRISTDYSADKPLYVAATGAITNVASALLMDPTLAERIFVVWLGGQNMDTGHSAEFNMMQDVAAARVVFSSGVPLVLLPASGVTSALATTKYELEYWLKGKNELCDYLLENTVTYTEARSQCKAWSKVIWDIAAIAWLLDKKAVADRIIPAPIPEYDNYFGFSGDRPPMRYAFYLDRDRVYDDLFQKLAKA